MTRPKLKDDTVTLSKQELMKLLTEEGALKGALQVILQEVLECEMEQSLQAAKGERTGGRQGYRSGYYGRSLITRVGKLELRVPQDRQGRFSTELFARYQRSEKALVAALMTMYVQGVSHPPGEADHGGALRARVQRQRRQCDQCQARRRTAPLLHPAAGGSVRLPDPRRPLRTGAGGRPGPEPGRADRPGRRPGTAAARSWRWSWPPRRARARGRPSCLGLKERGLHGVQVVVSDDHPGLKRAIMEVLPEARWQRCYVHFLRNAP
jgi:putative transposase